ncbi:hypothetical protein KAX06_02090 [candidate division WOR-3 bacterium]|nr:hypothetical protein [candidate division WOR-3 bacterium]
MRHWLVALAALAVVSLLGAEERNLEHADVNLWENTTFHQESVDCSRLTEGVIRAKIDGSWQEFEIRRLPSGFQEWSFGKRAATLERFRKHEPPELAGPHNAMVATSGIARSDSRFAINNAVKGMGWLPYDEKLAEIIELLELTIDEEFSAKLDRLDSLYEQGTRLYDPTRQVSLELYSTPEFETGTFLNQMVNPACAVVFLDIPSYEFKAIAHLMHPDDPKLTETEKLQVKYANLIHSYFHGAFDKQFIGVVYYVIEVYDNSPGKPEAKGKRVVPELPLMP